MKKLILAILITLIMAVPAMAAHLAWDYTDSSNVTGWIFYSKATTDGAKTLTYTLNDPTARTLDISMLPLSPGTKYNIWVTAYNGKVESGPSNTVSYTTDSFVPPANSKPITIIIPAPATVTITQP